jgi:hypothetical protein
MYSYLGDTLFITRWQAAVFLGFRLERGQLPHRWKHHLPVVHNTMLRCEGNMLPIPIN